MPNDIAADASPSSLGSAGLHNDPLFALLSAEDQAMFSKPFVPLIRAGKFFNRGRNTSYKAAKIGDIPTVEVCGQKFVSTAWLWETWRNGRLATAA